MKNTTLKEKLSKNQLTIGSWITIGHPSIAEIMGRAGFDWLTIDMEHNSIDPTMMQTLISTIQSMGVAALVRVPKNEEVVIKHAMDAGADGIIVPMINSREDAIKAVSYVKYPPEGKRGIGLSRAQNYGYSFDEYKEWLNRFSVVIAQIEHNDGIKNLEEIIQVNGIDGTIIGPYDLSGSLDVPGKLDDVQVLEAISKYKAICSNFNFPQGMHVIDSDFKKLQDKIDLGFSFLAFSTDFFFLADRIKNQFTTNNTKKNV